MSDWISDEEWEIIVQNVPIVSVDLIIECPDGIVLGRRSNEPAKGEWFVPGGRVRKNESLKSAVHRIGREELGVDLEIREMIGTFEHFYETSEIGCDKHYVAHGFQTWTEQTTFEADTQHGEISPFTQMPQDLHEYVVDYLREIDVDYLNDYDL